MKQLVFKCLFCFGCLLMTAMAQAEQGVTIEFNNVDLIHALTFLNQFLSLNMIISPAIQGNVSLHLVNASPQAALNLLLSSNGLSMTQQQNILYVAPLTALVEQQEKMAKWNTMQAEINPHTQFWHLKYAKAADVAHILQISAAPAANSKISYDARTNIIIARDTPARLATINAMIQQTDVAVPQVALAARLISVDSDYEQDLGIDFANAVNVTPGEYNIAAIKLPEGMPLDIKLAALERAGHAQLISSPSLFALNQQEAEIESGEEVPYQETSDSGGTAVQFKKAVLGLHVIPNILPHGHILLQLQINQDRPSDNLILGMPTISTRKILTSVLVKGGQTAVLGGIYETDKENDTQGIPFLSKLPGFGVLFKHNIVKETKRELLIFITPRIVT